MLHRPFNAKVPLRDDEPAHALSNRLARCNGVRSLQSFAGDQGLPATRSSTDARTRRSPFSPVLMPRRGRTHLPMRRL